MQRPLQLGLSTIARVTWQNFQNQFWMVRSLRTKFYKLSGSWKKIKAKGRTNYVTNIYELRYHVFCHCMFFFLNLIFDTGFVPEEWLISIIKPILKNNGDSILQENYIPYAWLRWLGKLLKSILCELLKIFPEKVELITDA